MNNENDIPLYDKIETVCQKIEIYTTKEASIKSKVKSDAYAQKIQKIIKKIDNIDDMKAYLNKLEKMETLEENSESNVKPKKDIEPIEKTPSDIFDEQYNPYSDKFCYKYKLEKFSGNIDKLIENLKQEDQLGYRNAYIINEIEKFVNAKKVAEKISETDTGMLNSENEEINDDDIKEIEIENTLTPTSNGMEFSEMFRRIITTIKHGIEKIKDFFGNKKIES